MDITIFPQALSGEIWAIPSKSQAHRLLICSAFADKNTRLICPETNQDIDATISCLNALGAKICRIDQGYSVEPIKNLPTQATLDCRESGSTLRFMLPIVGALGVDCTFQMSGRLPNRPLSPLWEEMERMGCCLSRPTMSTLRCTGRLKAGTYAISGKVSSQYITGLLFAMLLIDGSSQLEILDGLESKPYVDMTQLALATFGINTAQFRVSGRQVFLSPGTISVEGDWSNAAFFLAAQALGCSVTVNGLNPDSPQGDRAIAQLLHALQNNITISAADIPDLVPILAVVAGAKQGAVFTNIERLRLKESDRVATVAQMLRNLGAQVEITDSTMTVFPAKYKSCTIDAVNDHRIAMASAIAAVVADGPVTILGAHCVQKSYPAFWDVYRKLGGNYEQSLR